MSREGRRIPILLPTGRWRCYREKARVRLAASAVLIAPTTSQFSGVAVDASGNAYLAGLVSGTGDFSFGDGLGASGDAKNSNGVLVKYLGR